MRHEQSTKYHPQDAANPAADADDDDEDAAATASSGATIVSSNDGGSYIRADDGGELAYSACTVDLEHENAVIHLFGNNKVIIF